MKKIDLRTEMPKTAAFIDDLRIGFGREYIDNIIRRGMRGEPVFFAEENGHTIGTPVPQGVAVCTNDKGNRFVNHNFGKSGT